MLVVGATKVASPNVTHMIHVEIKVHSVLACMQHALDWYVESAAQIQCLTKIAIASQGTNNITEASITILDWGSSNNLPPLLEGCEFVYRFFQLNALSLMGW